VRLPELVQSRIDLVVVDAVHEALHARCIPRPLAHASLVLRERGVECP
jgi:hypothetical protein